MTTLQAQVKQNITKHPLIAGSFLLTLAGFVSRFIGFFYRMYLSQVFGEEGMGIYQLLGPVMALSFSLTAAGFQTSISKFVAERTEKHANTSLRPLAMGLSISLPASILFMLFLMQGSELISVSFLHEPRTASMLRILALSLPLSAVHACINGYFYGMKKATIPATAQLIEQLGRVLSVFVITTFVTLRGGTPTLNVTVIGLVIGEIISTIVTLIALFHHLAACKISYTSSPSSVPTSSTASDNFSYRMLFGMAVPLIANRITLNLLQSVETVSIPANLRLFGYDNSTALSVYGVLTGMAFPLLFFPNAITSSFAVLLLPMISERISLGDSAGVKKLTAKTIHYCSLLGFSCMAIFLLFGNILGTLLFHSELAGYFITTLGFICPFLYLNNTLSAILQGMGKVLTLFVFNVCGLLIRLCFIHTFIPTYGIQGYLWGLLASQLFLSTAYLFITIRAHK
ncbi:MAG: polysaccharide biosynthesis protein [Lachnospiraceae bacterium]|nr:polysaccharide biosynthesis protein [Lachnospiraceae bacterium]